MIFYIFLLSVCNQVCLSYLCACVLSRFTLVQLFATLRTIAHQTPLSMGVSTKSTGVGCHALLQGIFLTQGSNLRLLCLLNCRQILYALRHLGSPKENSRWPGIEPESTAWKAAMLTTIPPKSESCVILLCPTLCDPVDYSLLAFSV